MSKRFVARVALPGSFRRGRLRTDGLPVARGVATPPTDAAAGPAPAPPPAGATATSGEPPAAGRPGAAVRPPGTDPAIPGPVKGSSPAPAVQDVSPARGVATPPPTDDVGSTQLLQAPDVTAEIFVDRSGRRARVLRRVVSAAVLLALLLIMALWVSQGVDALGLRA